MKLLLILIFFSDFFFFMTTAQAQNLPSPLNISGHYQCIIKDSNGTSFHSQVTYTLDSLNTDFSKGYSTYYFDGVSQFGTHYLGEAIAKGDQLAIYAHNSSPENPEDAGIEISTITQQKPSATNKNPLFILNNLMYSPKHLYNLAKPEDSGSVISITCQQIS
jgi:hypothetical protein